MKRGSWLLIIAGLLMASPTALASLRGLGRIAQVGLTDGDVHHLGIVLKECEWEAVVSTDGGQTWQVARKDRLPQELRPLPTDGLIRYSRLPQDGLIRSDDGGRTWQEVAPWRFLDRTIQDDVEAEKRLFHATYGRWLPDHHSWPLVFGGTSILLVSFGGCWCCKQRCGWLAPVLLSLTSYVIVGIGLVFAHGFFIQWLGTEQWANRLRHWDGCITVPLWPLGTILHLTGNAWCAPVMAIVWFPTTALFGRFTAAPTSSRRARLFRAIAVGLVLAFLVLAVIADVPGLGRDVTYGLLDPRPAPLPE